MRMSTAQPNPPRWAPDPWNASGQRWWDGTAWTGQTQPAPGLPQPAPGLPQPATSSKPPSGGPIVAGLLFVIAAGLALVQVLYANNRPISLRVGLLVGLPFNWHLLLYPALVTIRLRFSWVLIPPVVVLAVCAIVALVMGRRRPRVAALIVAGALTIQNLLMLIPLFVDAGTGGVRPIGIIRRAWTNPTGRGIAIVMLVLYVVVLVMPILMGLAGGGRSGRRPAVAAIFFVLAGLYFAVYMTYLLADPINGMGLITPGPSRHAVTWLAPLSTLSCLVAMVLLVVANRRHPAPQAVRHGV